MRFNPWKCPHCGQPAKGTVEEVTALADLTFDDDGDAEYEGTSHIDWDSMRTCEDDRGMVTLQCECGNAWSAEMEGSSDDKLSE